MAVAWMHELARELGSKTRDMLSVKMPARAVRAYLNRGHAPGQWQEELAKLRKRIAWRRTNSTTKKSAAESSTRKTDQLVNSAADLSSGGESE